MTLPKIQVSMFDEVIPSSKKAVKIKQMTARDDKILLMAKASTGNDQEKSIDILNAIIQVINNNIVTPGIIVEKLSLFDIEYLFIKLRAISTNNIIEARYHDADEYREFQTVYDSAEPDKQKDFIEPKPYEFKIDLNKVTVVFPENQEKSVNTNDFSIFLKYPDVSLYSNKEFLEDQPKQLDRLALNCIECIKSGDSLWPITDKKELEAWIDDLPVKYYDEIKAFLNNLPHIHYELNYTNKFKTERKIVLNKLSDFFTF